MLSVYCTHCLFVFCDFCGKNRKNLKSRTEKSKVLCKKIQSFCWINLKFKCNKPYIRLKFNHFIQYPMLPPWAFRKAGGRNRFGSDLR